MIGHKLRSLLVAGVAIFVALELVADFFWLKSNLAQPHVGIDGVLSPMWLGPIRSAFLALVQGGMLLTLLSIDLRLQKRVS